jgi:hypothetical protein
MKRKLHLCKHCRFWQEDDEGDFGECKSEKLCSCMGIPPNSDCLWLRDENWVIISTGSEFGCIHWEERQ